ncbi:unnamed protein product [Spirodela intermedia]|uniref:Uncharacterized protein n=1 Tax=Spirodela intermedia TaxID=51605 RepID=A0A7I8IJE1_SPIIN|nr:unnamed protein product [Spirodela intermedia]CAA6658007.1 unnamed protein product [Spirodela intermedia]
MVKVNSGRSNGAKMWQWTVAATAIMGDNKQWIMAADGGSGRRRG